MNASPNDSEKTGGDQKIASAVVPAGAKSAAASDAADKGGKSGDPGKPADKPQADASADRPDPASGIVAEKTPAEAPADPATLETAITDPKSEVPSVEAETIAVAPPAAPAKPRDRMKPVRVWLWLLALMVFAMVIVGGVTRLTDSGLSITEWKLLSDVVPPQTETAWATEFEKYKKIPQYKERFSGMTTAQFKNIYFWEWGHRLLGRLIGVVFLLPFLYFLVTRRMTFGLFWKLCALLALGAIQGAVGWWMVKSGLAGRTEVAAERLAVHLLLASITLAGLVWVAMSLRKQEPEPAARDMRGEASGIIVAILIQIGLGALVAGSRAGLTYNTWPLMDGHLVPSMDKLFKLEPLWRNFVDNPTMVQFQHRIFAYLLLLLILGHAFKAVQVMDGSKALRRAWALTAIALVQAAIGVLTLLYVVPSGKIPIHLAITHQAVAMLLLVMAIVHRAALGRPGYRSTQPVSPQRPVQVGVPPDDAAIAT